MPVIAEFVPIERKIKAMLASRDIFGLILLGPPGMGKSYTSERVVKESGRPFAMVNSYSTKLALYMLLYKNRDKIIIFDDAVNVIEQAATRSMLLAGLWSNAGKRTIQYNSTSKILENMDVPLEFEFTGRIIWNTNFLPKKVAAVKSRCYYHVVNWPYKARRNILKQICLSLKVNDDIRDFILNKCTRFCRNFDFRLIKKFTGYFNQGPGWEELALSELEFDAELELVWDLSKKYDSTTASKKFVIKTGMSRRTFFNYKKQLGLSRKYKVI